MWPVSSAFAAAVRLSHQATFRAVVQNSGTVIQSINPMGGSVSVDSRRDVRRTCTDLILANGPGDDLIPANASAPLSPLTDNEVALYRGIRYADGSVEEVPLGVFGFDSFDAQDGREGPTLTLTGLADRSRIVTRSRWWAPYTIAAGTPLGTAIQAALRNRWPACPNLTIAGSATVGALVVFTEGADSDPWKDLCGLASGHGMELFFDAAGTPVLRPIPSALSSNLDATYQDGSNAVLLDVKRSVSATDSSYNGVVVTGETVEGQAPVRSILWDGGTIPARPRPMFYTSSFITTQAQADTTCRSLLSGVKGATEIVSWSQVVNPALDVWDLVRIIHPAVKASTDVFLDSLTIPFSAKEPMTATGRAKTVWA